MAEQNDKAVYCIKKKAKIIKQTILTDNLSKESEFDAQSPSNSYKGITQSQNWMAKKNC